MPKLFWKYNLLGLLIIVVIYVSFLSTEIATTEFIRSGIQHHRLRADSQYIKYPGLSFKSLQSHEFQNYVEALVFKKLRLKNLFISINNAIYYWGFKKSFAENGQVIVGKNYQLFELGYIIYYCKLQERTRQPDYFIAQEKTNKNLIVWADKLQKMHRFFKKNHQIFIYLITPSKAEYLASAIPDRIPCQGAAEKNTHIAFIKKLLDHRKVPYVDASSLMVAGTKKYGVSMFPQGGTHWDWLGATLGANALIHAINSHYKIHLQPLQFNYVMAPVDVTTSTDADLISMTLPKKREYGYLTPQVTFTNPKPPGKYVLSVIGGSFDSNLLVIFDKNNIFKKMNYFYYFDLLNDILLKENKSKEVPPTTEEIIQKVIHSDVVILEENAAITLTPHGEKFFQALKNAGYIKD